jgi:hypothetical protein
LRSCSSITESHLRSFQLFHARRFSAWMLLSIKDNRKHSLRDSSYGSLIRFMSALWTSEAPTVISRLTRITHATEKLPDRHGDVHFNFTLSSGLSVISYWITWYSHEHRAWNHRWWRIIQCVPFKPPTFQSITAGKLLKLEEWNLWHMKEELNFILWPWSFRAGRCVALQSLEGQWLLLTSEHSSVVSWNEVVHCGTTKLSANVWRWCAWYKNHQGLVWQVYSDGECTQNSLEVCVGMFPKRQSKKFALRSTETQVNPSVKHRGNCMYHDNAPSTKQAAAFVSIQSADYPGTEAGGQAKATRRSYWHAASDRYGSLLPSKPLVVWRGYVPPVGKSQSAHRTHMGLGKSSHPQRGGPR